MKNIKTYSCGNGDGMFENEDNGAYVERLDYEHLLEYFEAVFEIASNNCSGLSHDDLMEIVEKYEKC